MQLRPLEANIACPATVPANLVTNQIEPARELGLQPRQDGVPRLLERGVVGSRLDHALDESRGLGGRPQPSLGSAGGAPRPVKHTEPDIA
eukprot:4450369-Pyramimonas_sp.AAC.1